MQKGGGERRGKRKRNEEEGERKDGRKMECHWKKEIERKKNVKRVEERRKRK